MADDREPETIVERHRREFEQAWREHQLQPLEPFQPQLMPCRQHPHNVTHRAAREEERDRQVKQLCALIDEWLEAGYDPAEDRFVDDGCPAILQPLRERVDDVAQVVSQPGYEPTFRDVVVFTWEGEPQVVPVEEEILGVVEEYFWQRLSAGQVDAILAPLEQVLDDAQAAGDGERLAIANRNFHGAMMFALQADANRRDLAPPRSPHGRSRCVGRPRRRGAGRPRIRRAGARRAAGVRSGTDPGEPDPPRPPDAVEVGRPDEDSHAAGCAA